MCFFNTQHQTFQVLNAVVGSMPQDLCWYDVWGYTVPEIPEEDAEHGRPSKRPRLMQGSSDCFLIFGRPMPTPDDDRPDPRIWKLAPVGPMCWELTHIDVRAQIEELDAKGCGIHRFVVVDNKVLVLGCKYNPGINPGVSWPHCRS